MDLNFNGLNEEEVIKSRELNGTNEIIEQKSETFLQKFLGSFNDPMIKILSVCCILLLVLSFFGIIKWIEPVSIAMAILVATIVSTLNEYSSGKKFRSLQEEASKILVKVYRNNNVKEILIDEVVVGDYVVLHSGDKVPADGIVVNGHFKVDNSVLNGESDENSKEPTSGEISFDDKIDFTNPHKTYRGAVVCHGEGVIRIEKVGMNTVNGVMMQNMNIEDTQSPLQAKLTDLAEKISKFGYIGAVIIGILNFFYVSCLINDPSVFFASGNYLEIAKTVLDSLIYAIIIVVMAVPEGLPLMIAIVLSQNMQKMLKDNVLVRKLVGIETAGSLNILFSDKTGTITKGRLEVILFQNGNFDSYKDYKSIPDSMRKLVNTAISKNTSSIISDNGDVIGGNSTERSILGFIDKNEIDDNIEVKTKQIFNSTNKYSASELDSNLNLTFYKGAPERLLDKCTSFYDNDGNKHEFTNKAELVKIIDDLAEKSIRVLALTVSEKQLVEDVIPEDMIFLGILGIRDDIRPEAVKAIEEVMTAGIQVIMITGDRKETAVAIAKDSKLLTSDDQVVLTSDELQAMSDEEIKKVLPKIRVIARALPMDKFRLVGLAQELGLVAGMTGDGVNDAPALKKSDIGFAMGSGTEIAKEVGDIIILDDNFQSIEKAVLYGRTIYNNIKKFLRFQLNINISAVLISVVAPFIGVQNPLTILQILWINMIMDTLAALALGGEPALAEYMKERPKNRNEKIVSNGMGTAILWTGIWTTIISLVFLKLNIFRNLFNDDLHHLTAYFCLFVFSGLFNGLNVRSEKLNVFANLKLNPNFIKVFALIFVIQIVLVYIGGEVFRTVPLSVSEWLVIFGLSVLIIPVDMLRKLIFSGKNK
ncbi:calcium-translocating P-type ATPase, PMCA-type [Sebaldella sp. S0638]|uniref:calcium-translocating P-type ATPase, PMCA-type n=1 Tax=Sebaldella sp. S0638 TaxID=2957809 RepID=UPI0020A1D926|nr:calcium-translocating P-type ATPase, PMCA-type [Sebaldella sp. S0638]MCP1225533.1 calcium-translocating P-type ATPase, PMCA-type [Sebaldella sp. S0638]